ncbi:MAG: peptide-methionine (S)-S-oxide reductase [Gammaproteobacteria bacterium RIFCSPLOWO2_02_FULL_56_15]|nr:MAG: peptide-methionine (S)-S-oxide reductase [Gammaproteobacteria bacterium RIFCSPLOWO2_02_FULL_56_15]
MKRLCLALLLLILSSPAFCANETAIFAGGCFWCMEPPFDKLEGVISTTSGYTGGELANPSYEQVSDGQTGHYESLRVEYDPEKIRYQDLLEVYWRNIDPFDNTGQFCDHGQQYLSAIFYQDREQEKQAKNSKDAVQQKAGESHTVVTRLIPAKEFYPAEDYHQDYYLKNPVRYKYYRYGCGRDKRLEDVQKLLGK